MVCDLVSESHRFTSSRNILPLQKSKSGRLSEKPSSFEKGVSPHFLSSVAPTNPAATITSYKTQWRRLQTPLPSDDGYKRVTTRKEPPPTTDRLEHHPTTKIKIQQNTKQRRKKRLLPESENTNERRCVCC